MAYSVNSNGLVQTGTSLQSKYGLDFVSKLVRPEGKEIVDAGNDASLVVSQEDVLHFMNDELSKDEIANLYNMILRTDGKIAFEAAPFMDTTNMDNISKAKYFKMRDKYHYATRQILNEVDSYSKSVLTSDSDPNYLKNRVVSGIFEITTKLQNQLIAQIPVDMGDPQTAAEQSTLGRAELHINSDDPSAKMMMQQQNAVGKEVIGISAVSLKAFFGLYYYYSGLTDDLKTLCENNASDEAIVNALEKLLFIHPITKELTSLANIDIEQVLDVVKINNRFKKIQLPFAYTGKLRDKRFYNESDNTFNLVKLCKHLVTTVNLTDAALTDSSVISAATD